jgi:hypothetical protein
MERAICNKGRGGVGKAKKASKSQGRAREKAKKSQPRPRQKAKKSQ